MAEFEVLQQREQLEAVEGAPDYDDDDCDGDDEEDVDGADYDDGVDERGPTRGDERMMMRRI